MKHLLLLITLLFSSSAFAMDYKFNFTSVHTYCDEAQCNYEFGEELPVEINGEVDEYASWSTVLKRLDISVGVTVSIAYYEGLNSHHLVVMTNVDDDYQVIGDVFVETLDKLNEITFSAGTFKSEKGTYSPMITVMPYTLED